jgi:hypothetical protein
VPLQLVVPSLCETLDSGHALSVDRIDRVGTRAHCLASAWVAIAPSGKVTLQCAHSEMGQCIFTTFAAVIAATTEASGTTPITPGILRAEASSKAGHRFATAAVLA